MGQAVLDVGGHSIQYYEFQTLALADRKAPSDAHSQGDSEYLIFQAFGHDLSALQANYMKPR